MAMKQQAAKLCERWEGLAVTGTTNSARDDADDVRSQFSASVGTIIFADAVRVFADSSNFLGPRCQKTAEWRKRKGNRNKNKEEQISNRSKRSVTVPSLLFETYIFHLFSKCRPQLPAQASSLWRYCLFCLVNKGVRGETKMCNCR